MLSAGLYGNIETTYALILVPINLRGCKFGVKLDGMYREGGGSRVTDEGCAVKATLHIWRSIACGKRKLGHVGGSCMRRGRIGQERSRVKRIF